MKNLKQSALIFLGLAVLILLFFSPALWPGRALYLRDLSIEIIPYRSFWARSHGFALWNPYGFFGMPFAANPQMGAFYPLNLIFFISPVWKALTVYIIVHYLLAAFSACLLFRELEFSPATCALLAIALVFSGIFCSLSNLVVLLSVASWLPLSGWLVVRSLKGRWLWNVLWLSIIFALSNLAGDPQVFAANIIIAAALGLVQAWKSRKAEKSYAKLLAGMALALLLAALLTSPQNFLTLEMLPYSNRAAGYTYEEFTLWSLIPKNLLTLFFPNNFLPADNILWFAGFLLLPSFLLSIYPGISVLLLGAFSFRADKKQAALWLGVFLLGIFLALGRYNPCYRIFYELPFLRLLRIPEKFFWLAGFSLVMLAALGMESLWQKPLKARPILAIAFFIAGLGLLLASLFLHHRGLHSEVPLQAKQMLIFGSALKSLAFLFAAGAWMLALGDGKKPLVFALGLALILYLDLAGSHLRLNPTTASSFYTSQPAAASELGQIRSQSKETVRIASVHPSRDELLKMAHSTYEYYAALRDWMDPFWGIYYQLDDVLSKGSFYLAEIDLFHDLLTYSLWPERIYARGAVRYVYQRDQGLKPLPGALDRAMVFYQAEVVPDRENLVRLWSGSQFAADREVLLEKAIAEMPANSDLAAEPASILSYSNQRVVVKFRASVPGWLVLFDTFYPGWRASVDGKEISIQRADVFFRAVPVPAGEHAVEFRYLPSSLVYGIIIGGAGLMLWFSLLIFAQRKWKQRIPIGPGSSFSWF